MLRLQDILQGRWIAVWQRNFAVWRRLMVSSIIAGFGEPLLYLSLLGYGLGRFIGTIDGMPYGVFLASGIVASSAMNNATFETLYSGYTRMAVQDTWQGILSTPMSVADVVVGEIVWAATKACISVTMIMLVVTLFGLTTTPTAIMVLPLTFLIGLCFASMGLIITSMAHSYDFFLYYTALFITPLLLLSGVYFPLSEFSESLQLAMHFLPLVHAVKLCRAAMTDTMVSWGDIILGIVILAGYAYVAMNIAVVRIERRLQI